MENIDLLEISLIFLHQFNKMNHKMFSGKDNKNFLNKYPQMHKAHNNCFVLKQHVIIHFMKADKHESKKIVKKHVSMSASK